VSVQEYSGHNKREENNPLVDGSDNPVKEWLNSPIPERLWHYTSIQGFCGITSSKNIFATDIRFLNDSSEFIHARSITEQVIADAPEKDENGWPLQKNLRQIISLIFEQGALSSDSLEIYTASFSAAEDQLSQWRGYSRGSSGTSLGLDLRSLRPSPGVGTLVTFAPCVYEDGKKRELLTHALYKFARDLSSLWQQAGDVAELGKILNDLRTYYPEWTEEKAKAELQSTISEWHEGELKRAGAVITIELLQLVGLLKHSSFVEEREWRLILPVSKMSTPKLNPRRYRPGAKSIVPYIEFPLPLKADTTIPLTDLILGPGAEPVIGLDSARSFLSSEKIDVVPRESNVPFRPS
jgi:DUF2971 family protein